MTEIAAMKTPVRLRVAPFRLADRFGAGKEFTQVSGVVYQGKIYAGGCVHLVIAIHLRIVVYKILLLHSVVDL